VARLLKAPIVHSLRGKEYIEYDNPYDVGMTGLVGFASGYAGMKNCNALLLLGTDYPYRQFYPDHARISANRHSGRGVGQWLSTDSWSIRPGEGDPRRVDALSR